VRQGQGRSPVSLRRFARMTSRPAISPPPREREKCRTDAGGQANRRCQAEGAESGARRKWREGRSRLEGELASARKTIASAAKPSNAEVTARDAASPTGPLNRPIEGSNAASEITASITTPQSGGNITAAVQVSSDATPADATATAGASGQLTRSNRSQPGRPNRQVRCLPQRRQRLSPAPNPSSGSTILSARGFCSLTPWIKAARTPGLYDGPNL